MENVRVTVDLAYDVALIAIGSPRTPGLVAWAAGMQHVPDAMAAWRAPQPSPQQVQRI